MDLNHLLKASTGMLVKSIFLKIHRGQVFHRRISGKVNNLLSEMAHFWQSKNIFFIYIFLNKEKENQHNTGKNQTMKRTLFKSV